MKNILVTGFIITLLFHTDLFAQVKFIDAGWEDGKKMALKENKLIFVDAFTDWCGWCKKMDSETFQDTAVGKFMNSHFIPLKFDMEQGFGKRLAMKYHVRSFPTYLVCNADGKLVYTTDGYSNPAEFTEILKKAIDPAFQTNAKGMSDIVELPYPEFYQLQFEPQSIKKVADSATVQSYLDKQTDLFSEINWAVLYIYPTSDKYNRYFLDHIETYRDLFGNKESNEKLYSIYYIKLKDAIQAKDEKKLDEIVEMIGKYSNENVEREKVFYKILYYSDLKDWVKLSDNINEMIRMSGYEYARMISEYAFSIYRFCDNDTIINTALDWMKHVVATDPQFFYLNTYAYLLFKTKNYDEAGKYAQMALDAGTKANEKTRHTEELIKKIEDAKNAEKK